MNLRHSLRTATRRRLMAGLALLLGADSFVFATEPGSLPDGLWRSRGYGLLVEVRGGQFRAWDVTPVSCIERVDAGRMREAIESVQVADDGRTLTLRTRELLTVFTYDRVAALPPACSAPPAANQDDPVLNFEVLWHLFEQDYAFFRERAVDWHRQYAIFRPRIRAGMSQSELFELFAQMLAPLDDRHVNLIGPGGRLANTGMGPVLQPIADEFAAQSKVADFREFWRSRLWPYHEATVEAYLGSTVRRFGPNLVAGRVGPDLGYLFVASMYGYSEGDAAANRAAAAEALDAAFAYLDGVSGIILDLRLNTGGDDAIALAIAGRFTDTARPAFTKSARHGDSRTAPQQLTVTPAAEHRFTGPVVVLISHVTTSAAENLAMVMRTFPNVVLVGERTAGAHSDVLPKRLPNGWMVTISNEIFENSDGIVYEGIGVPPSIEAPWFTPDALSGTADRGMDTAIELLRTRK